MFPTKALAQDQLGGLRALCAAAFGDRAPVVEVYDGDTDRDLRPSIRWALWCATAGPGSVQLQARVVCYCRPG